MSNFDLKVREAFCGQQYYAAKDFKAFTQGFGCGRKDRQPEIDHLKKWGAGKENKALKSKLANLQTAYDIQAKALDIAHKAAESGGNEFHAIVKMADAFGAANPERNHMSFQEILRYAATRRPTAPKEEGE